MVTIQQLKYFIEAVESASLTQAAKNLYLSQPALTKQMAAMERTLQCRLLLRGPSGVRLTEAGHFLYDKAHSIVSLYEQTLDGLQQLSERSTLRIGALPSLASSYLPALAGKLRTEFGKELVVTIRDTSKELADLVITQEIDVALMQDFEGHRLKGLSVTPLFREPYLAIVPKEHHFGQREQLSLRDLSAEKLVLHQYPCDIRSAFRRRCLSQGLEPNVGLELGFNESIIPFVANGQGVSIVPRMVALQINDSAVAAVKIDDPEFYRTICMASRGESDTPIPLFFQEHGSIHQSDA